MLKRLLTVVGLLLLAVPSRAADGDPCQTAATDWDALTPGQMTPVWCVVLCDNQTDNSDCTAYDLNTVGGIPDVVSFELHEVDINASGGAADCTAGTITINTTSDQGLTTASENAFNIGSTTAVDFTTNRIVLDARVLPPDRYILATSSNLDANCTDDGVDLLMVGYEEAN